MSKSRIQTPLGPPIVNKKNRPIMAAFLLNSAHFSVKTGLKNSYSPRVPLLGIFVRTRDSRTHIASG